MDILDKKKFKFKKSNSWEEEDELILFYDHLLGPSQMFDESKLKLRLHGQNLKPETRTCFGSLDGAMTLSIKAFRITTLNIRTFSIAIYEK